MADQWEQAAQEWKQANGGNAAAAPAAATPAASNDDWKLWQSGATSPQSEQPSFIHDTLGIPRSFKEFAESPNGFFRTGGRQIGQAIKELGTSGQREKGLTDLIQGGGRVLAPVGIGAAVPALVGAPGATLAGAAGGTAGAMLGGPAGEHIVKAFGGGPQAQELGRTIGETAGGAIGGGAGVLGERRIPDIERAGRNFQAVMGAARNVPIDLSRVSGPVLRAQELREAGSTMPSVMNKFLQRTTAPGSEPLTYERARDFASNAGRLSAEEHTRMTPPMKAQLSAFANELGNANREAAQKAGVGPTYDSAMNEYRNAMRIQAAKEAVGKAGKSMARTAIFHGIPLAAGGGIGYGLWKHFEH
jgi:hypothetical protein